MDCEYLDRKMEYDGTPVWKKTEQELRRGERCFAVK